jgi:ribulose kinase
MKPARGRQASPGCRHCSASALPKLAPSRRRSRRRAVKSTRTADSTDRTRLQAQEQQQRTELEKAVSQSQVDLQNLQRQISNELGVKVKAAIQDLVKGTGVQVVLSADHHGGLGSARTRSDLVVIERLNAQAAAPAPNNPEVACWKQAARSSVAAVVIRSPVAP